jgi:hypothetical protein
MIRHGHEMSMPRFTPREHESLVPINDRRGVKGYAIIDRDDEPLVSRYRWSAPGPPAAYVRACPTHGVHFSLHRLIMGLETGDPRQVTHLNGNPWDNRRANLRVCDVSGATQNRQAPARGASRFRGVAAHGSKWRAYADVRYQRHNLGTYETEDEAGAVAAQFRADHMPLSMMDAHLRVTRSRE